MRKLCFLFLMVVVLQACSDPAGEADYHRLQGRTMGTYYSITYADRQGRNFQSQIEDLLDEVNLGVSTYIDSSTISRFNQADSLLVLAPGPGGHAPDRHFLANFLAAREVFENSGGAFDPTVMPLVNYWGFGYTEKRQVTAVDSTAIDSLMQYVGFSKVTFQAIEPPQVRKLTAATQLDFSGIAKGYGVDAVGRWLETQGVRHYLVDIGGEARAHGLSPRGDDWNIGINVPRENASLTDIQTAVPLRDRSIATSGNYRNFYEVDGVKYSHTINPFSGFPERSRLLSASVFAEDCMTADAYATAFMVLGLDKAVALAERLEGVDAYFIYSTDDGAMDVVYTSGLKELFR